MNNDPSGDSRLMLIKVIARIRKIRYFEVYMLFGVQVSARFWAEIQSKDEMPEPLIWALPKLPYYFVVAISVGRKALLPEPTRIVDRLTIGFLQNGRSHPVVLIRIASNVSAMYAQHAKFLFRNDLDIDYPHADSVGDCLRLLNKKRANRVMARHP